MPRYLVVYYSWTGNTEKVANLIAKSLSADMERINEPKARSGSFAFPMAIVASLFKKTPLILPASKNVADYDVVILGCPVWASNMAAPMRSYILRENSGIKKLALFCTYGGSGGKAALLNMADLSGHNSLADLIVDRPALLSGKWNGLTESFVKQIQMYETTVRGPKVA